MRAPDVIRWRKAERERLIRDRLAIPSDVRREWNARIAVNLGDAIGDVGGLVISVYWPIRGEPDLQQFIEGAVAHRGRVALPVVIAHGQPLVFRAWSWGQPLEPGIWGLRVPVADADLVEPDVVVAPVVGFDSSCYRLGYGGGFFDRTLAAMPTRPRTIGVGYQRAHIATIYPQAHDIPMSVMVTEQGVLACPPSAAHP